MSITESEISELINFLESNKFDIEEFDKLYQSINRNNIFTIKLIDFEYYCDIRLEDLKKEKLNYVTSYHFDEAALYRDLEKECMNYIHIKTTFNIEKSTFHYEENYLLYFYLGTAKNDKVVREYLKKEML